MSALRVMTIALVLVVVSINSYLYKLNKSGNITAGLNECIDMVEVAEFEAVSREFGLYEEYKKYY